MTNRSLLASLAFTSLLAVPSVAFGQSRGTTQRVPRTATTTQTQVRPVTRPTTTPTTLGRPRTAPVQRPAAQQPATTATPATPAKSWSYVNQSIKKDREVNESYEEMVNDLNGGATPAIQIFPRDLPRGISFDQVPTGEKDPMHEVVKGLKGGSISAVLLLPTSGHFGTPASEVAKNQKHTVWVVHSDGSKSTVVDGAASFDGKAVVTAVRAEIPLKPGVNKVFFDPYPGKTGGVGGFAAGRTWIYEVK